MKSKYRGHDIEMLKNSKWIFSNTRKFVSENIYIKCGYCGGENTEAGNDKCLGTIKWVMNACCGHGIKSEAYIQLMNGECIRGEKVDNFLIEIISYGGKYGWNRVNKKTNAGYKKSRKRNKKSRIKGS